MRTSSGAISSARLCYGDVIDLGDRAFEVVHTPGHSPSGIALWEASSGVLLSDTCSSFRYLL